MHTTNREVDQFNDYDWWDQQGPLWTLHAINPIRLALIHQHIRLAGKHVLDLGCGGGILSESLAMCGATVTGIDPNQQAIAKARVHQQAHEQTYQKTLSLHYECMDVAAYQAANPDKTFSVITCMEMLEHVADPQAVIQSCTALLKTGGLLFLSTLNRNLKSYLSAVIAGEYWLKILPRGTHDYAKFIRPDELDQYCHKAQLVIKDMQGIRYNPLTKRFSKSQDITVNYMVVAEKRDV